MADLYGIRPLGHPEPRRLVRHAHWPEDWHPMRTDAGPAPQFQATGRFPFVTVGGTGVYENPVGPVYARLIEPGHFRFSVVGETVLRLKARLWFVHRGLKKLFEGRPATGAADLGALANDIDFVIASAHAQRIREQLLRVNAVVTGHRLLRGAIYPGGVTLRRLPAATAVDRY
jgi:Ni,Fe-hydrogenase III large subunit